MAVIMILDVEGVGTDTYEAVNDRLGIRSADSLPDGCIAHAAGPTDGGLLIADVWESAEAFQTFASERLGPMIVQIMGDDAPTPSVEIRELYDVIKGAG